MRRRCGWSRREHTVVSIATCAGLIMGVLPSVSLARVVRHGAPPTQPRLEHTIGAMRSAELLENNVMRREIVSAGSTDAPAVGTPGRWWVSTRTEPSVGPADPPFGPVLLPERDVHATARGGGPRVTRSLVSADMPSSRGIEPAGPRVVSAPLGCSRIDAAGAPGVRSIRLSVTSQNGRVLAHAERAGRVAALQFCPPTDGAYTIRASGTGGTVRDPVQIFVE